MTATMVRDDARARARVILAGLDPALREALFAELDAAQAPAQSYERALKRLATTTLARISADLGRVGVRRFTLAPHEDSELFTLGDTLGDGAFEVEVSEEVLEAALGRAESIPLAAWRHLVPVAIEVGEAGWRLTFATVVVDE